MLTDLSCIVSLPNILVPTCKGDSDVGGIVMFVMIVTDLRCWWQNHYVGDFFRCWWFSQCIKSVTNILNRSPTSQTCHQHIWSPTSVANIDVSHQNIRMLEPNLISAVFIFAFFSKLAFLLKVLQSGRNFKSWHLKSDSSNFLSNFYRIFTGLLDIGSFVDLDSCFLFPFEPVLEFFFCAATIDNSKIIPTKTKIK